jgi:signal transduction histidine kinase/CheY-like chemotaxis protein
VSCAGPGSPSRRLREPVTGIGSTLIILVVAIVLGLCGWLALRVRFLSRSMRQLRAEIDTMAITAKTERRRADEAVRRALQAEKAALTAGTDRSRFLAAASHDLRQPIHAVTLFVAALKLQPLEGRSRYLVDHLDRSLTGLDELFNRLLDIARLDGGAIQPQVRSFGIATLLSPLGPRFQPVASERQLDFRVRLGPDDVVRTDPVLLVEILMNLLSNALRYTRRGGVLLGTRRRGGMLRIEVWDTGIGIAPREIGRIFEEFVQLDNPSRDRRKGLGLGLAIVRRLTDRLGHRLEVASHPGRGSVFALVVPIEARAARSVPVAAVPADLPDLSGLLVLVVDDEIDILIATEALLKAWGCLVLVARSVDEATRWVHASERFPDVLITDYRLGEGMTAHDVVAAVGPLVPGRLPVLVLSAESTVSESGVVPSQGWSHMTKPVDERRLRAQIAALAAEEA